MVVAEGTVRQWNAVTDDKTRPRHRRG